LAVDKRKCALVDIEVNNGLLNSIVAKKFRRSKNDMDYFISK
jgi:hypothetical protein